MDRRDFLKTTGATAAAATLSNSGIAAVTPALASGRTVAAGSIAAGSIRAIGYARRACGRCE